MASARSPRYQGKITTWKDDQGFGFITPNGGGPTVFVHIKSFSGQRKRPVGNEIVTYELTVNGKGERRAENVAFVLDRVSRPDPQRKSVTSLVAAVAFLGLIAISVLTGRLPRSVFGLYLGVSAFTFFAYGLDKSAARNNQWRTRESTLHLLGLAGGWPGAIIAQRVFRHKSSKQAFQIAFWFTVAVNCSALGWLLSRSGLNVLQAILGSL